MTALFFISTKASLQPDRPPCTDRQPVNLPSSFQPTPQSTSSAIRTEAVTFNSGITAERECPPILIGHQKLGLSSRNPAFLLALVVLVIVVAMSALQTASCEKAAAAAADLGEDLSRPQQRPESRMLASRPRQARLTKEWRQDRQVNYCNSLEVKMVNWTL